MAKAVLLSIRHEWVAKISGGVKTAEVRKNRPKLEPPFKCYIYCTMPNTKDPHKLLEIHGTDGKIRRGNGKVVGEFICDKITIHIPGYKDHVPAYWDLVDGSCLTTEELMDYGKWNTLYGWRISELKIYDVPKPLSAFWFPPEIYCEKELCGGCPCDCGMGYDGDYMWDCGWKRPLKWAPQSWCYVEEL